MKRWPLLFIILAGAIATARADGWTYGIGVNSCAQFSKDYVTNPAAVESVYFSWAQGFISGLIAGDVAAKVAQRRIEGGEENTMAYMLSIRRYCAAQPLSMYADAVLEVYNHLPFSR